jgi:acetyl-CoA carboxylase, biotin carboxylase subunit
MQEAGVPILPGSENPLESEEEALKLAREIGFPVIVKAAAGGGGRGMAIARSPEELPRVYAETRASAQALFGDPSVYIEKYLDGARHIEVQVLADRYGNVVHLGARDCSVQRRRQKLVEETPPAGLPTALLDRMGELSVRAARRMRYAGVGTFEFLVDAECRFYFMEINCRIQVEHPVTEAVMGLDLVREQLLVASGARLTMRQSDLTARGAAIECRINAEDPARAFAPAPGTVDEFSPPAGPFVRVDSHCYPGARVTADYDPLLAKIIVWAPDRDQAIARMDRALGELRVRGRGLYTTTGFLREVLAHPLFRDAKHATGLVDAMQVRPE